MKRILSILLVAVMLVSMLALSACNEPESSAKLGFGIYSVIEEASDADGEEKNGKANVVHTAAAVLLDEKGVIVSCYIDAIDLKAEYTANGEYVTPGEFKTKWELGDDYNMKTYGKAELEWYEQVEAFVGVVKGKTLEEVKALVAENGKGNDAVTSAGCTITVSEFVYAIEKACAATVDTEVKGEATLGLGIETSYEGKNADEENNGSMTLDTTFVALAKDADGKVLAASTDAISVELAFTKDGASATDKTKSLTTKKNLGANYNMSKYGQDLNNDGQVKEWFEQAKVFDDALVSLDKAGVTALAVSTGYGVESLQTAGCTINISDMVKAAVKAF